MIAASRSVGSGHRILVVEDEPLIAEIVERYLRRDGHAVEVVGDGEEALRSIEARRPSLMVLDLMLPGVDGIEVCRRVRERSQLPIIILSARSGEVDKLRGLSTGANDYVTKPFSPRELAARVAAVLRRTGDTTLAERELQAGSLRLDPVGRQALSGDRPINLTAREFSLLFYLASHPGRAFSRAELLDAIWDESFSGGDSTVTVAHAAAPREGRGRPLEAPLSAHGLGRRLQVRAVMPAPLAEASSTEFPRQILVGAGEDQQIAGLDLL